MLLVLLSFLPMAAACKRSSNPTHTLDAIERGSDPTPPGAPMLLVSKIDRGQGRDACGLSSSCDDLGQIVIAVTAADDRTAQEKLGYRLTRTAVDCMPGAGGVGARRRWKLPAS